MHVNSEPVATPESNSSEPPAKTGPNRSEPPANTELDQAEPMAVMPASSQWRVVLLYNLKHLAYLDPESPLDALADYDTMETVQAVENALRSAGHQVISLEADTSLLDSIRSVNPDICFNMARGIEGEYRETQIPALLDMLHIPYTGSDVLTLAMTRSKLETKRIWNAHGLPTAAAQEMSTSGEELDEALTFPLMVKPLYGKLGMGIDADSVVYNHTELDAKVDRIVRLYDQPALVEQYLPGREFVVGVVGNSGANNGYRCLPILEIDSAESIGEGIFTSAARALPPADVEAPTYSCPASIKRSLEAELMSLAIAAFDAVGAADTARIDFRLDENGAPNILSINVHPNLEPEQGLFAQMAAADGISFNNLVAELLNLALERHSLLDSVNAVSKDDAVASAMPVGMPIANWPESLLIPT